MKKQNLSNRAVRQQETDFRIMQAIADNPQISQRGLAKELGLSLGRTHYCLSALIKIGWVKVGNFASSKKKKQYAYILTPSGLAQKSAITHDFLRQKIEEYEALRLEIERLNIELNAVDGFESSPSAQMAQI